MKLKNLLVVVPIMMTGLGFSQAALADDWGCQVLLCLSDPRGPTTESECRPPIEKLWRHLAKGRSFPSCAMAGSPSSGTGSFAKQVYERFDPCPDDLVPAGGNIAQSELTDSRQWRRLQYQVSSHGIANDQFDNNYVGPRACVGKHLGNYTTGNYDDRITISVFDKVVWQKPQNPRAIDVHIDGNFYKRVRY